MVSVQIRHFGDRFDDENVSGLQRALRSTVGAQIRTVGLEPILHVMHGTVVVDGGDERPGSVRGGGP